MRCHPKRSAWTLFLKQQKRLLDLVKWNLQSCVLNQNMVVFKNFFDSLTSMDWEFLGLFENFGIFQDCWVSLTWNFWDFWDSGWVGTKTICPVPSPKFFLGANVCQQQSLALRRCNLIDFGSLKIIFVKVALTLFIVTETPLFPFLLQRWVFNQIFLKSFRKLP